MQQVEVDRAYRVVGILEQTVHDITQKVVPKLQGMLALWRRRVLWADAIVFGTTIAAVLIWTLMTGEWFGMSFSHPFWSALLSEPVWSWVILGVVVIMAGYIHLTIRQLAARSVMTKLRRETSDMREQDFVENFIGAFQKNTSIWHSVWHKQPVGWGKRAQRRLRTVLIEANRYVQDLNDTFTNPSGKGIPVTPKPVVEVEKSEKVGA
jgi:hypothetical protein